jgi:hypothetical protein
MMKHTDCRCVGLLLAVLTALLFSVLTAAAYDEQPANQHSTLIDRDGRNAIRDNEFAQWMRDLLLRNGQRNAHNATFLFQQCFSGGMLDDLVRELGGRVPWVGGAAARHDLPAFGEPPRGRDRRPEGYWSEELLDLLQARNRTVLDALRNAGRNDPLRRIEHPQHVQRGGGDQIRIDKGREVQSRHAILWAGQAGPGMVDAQMHVNMINRMRRLLVDRWGRPDGRNTTISVLFGNGQRLPNGTPLPNNWNAQPATRENLQAAINALNDGNPANGEMNPNEQFVFYSADHGGHQVDRPGPRRVGSNTNHRDTIEVPTGVQTGMLTQTDNEPTLTVEYTGVTVPGAVPVSWNGNLLGYLEPHSSQMMFPIPEDMIALNNDVEVMNHTLSEITVERLLFDSGSIGLNLMVIPEPASVLALLTGVGGLLLKRRKD